MSGAVTVAIDGTKILANASRHSAVSYERAGEQLRQVELEIERRVPMVAAIVPVITAVKEILVDRGFVSEKAITQLESDAHGRPTG